MLSLMSDNVALAAGDTVRWYAAAIGNAVFAPGSDGLNRAAGEFVVEYVGPSLVSE
jgi:hypothetical protein